MNRQDRAHLLAEQKFLQERLAELPQAARIMRISTESRLRRVIEECLTHEPVDERGSARTCLTFSGRPVVGGSHGIFASFATEAMSRFTEAVSAVAASLTEPLAAAGPIPDRGQNRLLITQTAIGSFGFELEEYQEERLPLPGPTAIELALGRIQDLLQGSIEPDDELLADSAAEIDLRAMDRIRAFVGALIENEAACALRFRDRVFRFNEPEQVRLCLQRISHDNLREEEQQLGGALQGILPKRRAFEFKLTEGGEVITGKIGPSIVNPAELNALLLKPISAKLTVTRVGKGRPRYLLLEALDNSYKE